MSKKIMIGKIISISKDGKIAKIEVEREVRHPIYLKARKVHTKYLVSAKMEVAAGDTVKVQEIRPLSHKIRFAINKIVSHGNKIEVVE